MDILRLKDVKKSFTRGEFEVLAGLSLAVKKGELICIIGPTGCGKSTLLQLIAGFIPVTAGEIEISGQTLRKPGPDVVLMFQHYAIFPWLNVRQNILFGLSAHHDVSSDRKNDLVNKYVELVGLSDFKNWFPHQLSGGMQQRVALARALIGQPKVLLMDEPFSSVDAQYREYLRQSLVKIWRETKTTIVFVTHSITEAVYLGGRVAVLSRCPGRIIDIIPVNMTYPRNRYSDDFIATSKKLEGLIEKPAQEMINQTFNNKNYVPINT